MLHYEGNKVDIVLTFDSGARRF